MMKLFKRSRKFKVRVGDLFFVSIGESTGQFLAVLKFNKSTDLYSIMLLPECDPIYLTERELSDYNARGAIDLVENLPRRIKKDLIKEFNLRISEDNA